jgi:hypothetical protein
VGGNLGFYAQSHFSSDSIGESIKNSSNFDVIDDCITPFLFENFDLLSNEILLGDDFNKSKFSNLMAGYYQLLKRLVDNYEAILHKYSVN